MEKLSYFDCNCRIGRRRRPGLMEFYSPQRLVEEMEYFNIEEALVYHSLAWESSPKIGNEKLLEEIKPYKQLHPAWVMIPHFTGEVPLPETQIKEMITKGVKAVRLFPGESMLSHCFSLARWCSGKLLSILENHRVPVLLSVGEEPPRGTEISLEKIHKVCSNYPELPLILCGNNFSHFNRLLYPLLGEFNNLYLEISGYHGAHRGLEDTANKYGAERLVFSSNMPVYTAGSAVMMVTYANLSFKEKKLIAKGNLRRLLGEVNIE